MWGVVEIIIIAIAGFIIGVTLGYVAGSDNGFVKGCNWAYHNIDKK